jgi:hypothetical protein
MITQDQIKEAEDKFPMPSYVDWYQNSFPSRIIAFTGAGFILVGMVFTMVKAGRIHMISVTFQILSLVVFLCTMLLIAIIKKKRTFKKRARYLGITLQEYLNLNNKNSVKKDIKEIDILIQRNPDNGKTTIGNISIGSISLVTIEDINRDLNHDGDITDPGEEKIYGESRIPCGRYELTLREEGTLHWKYKERFPEIHKGMLWMQDIPSFNWVYIHIANKASELLGCVGISCRKINDDLVEDSQEAYLAFYGYCLCLFDLGYRIFINIMDEK